MQISDPEDQEKQLNVEEMNIKDKDELNIKDRDELNECPEKIYEQNIKIELYQPLIPNQQDQTLISGQQNKTQFNQQRQNLIKLLSQRPIIFPHLEKSKYVKKSTLKSKKKEMQKERLHSLKILRKGYFTIQEVEKLSHDFARMIRNQVSEQNQKITLSTIAKKYGYKYSSISRLFTEYLEDDQMKYRQQRINRAIIKDLDGLTKERLGVLEKIMKENPNYSQKQIAKKMNEIQDLQRSKKYGKVTIQQSSVSRLLRIAGYTKKFIQKQSILRNNKEHIEKRFHFCKQLLQLMQQNKRIYFCDDLGFNVNSSQRRVWVKANEEIKLKNQVLRGQMVSVITIVGFDGLSYWQTKVGSYDEIARIQIINKIFQQLKVYNNSQSVLILDNCSIRDKIQIAKLEESQNLTILFFPPYSPQLNPIEGWFQQIRSQLKEKFNNQSDLLIKIKEILEAQKQQKYQQYYSQLNEALKKGLKKQLI